MICSYKVALAAAIPKIDLFISLIGALASSTLALIAPAVIHTMIFWNDFKGIYGTLKVARNLFLFFLDTSSSITNRIFGKIFVTFEILNFSQEGQEDFFEELILLFRWSLKHFYSL